MVLKHLQGKSLTATQLCKLCLKNHKRTQELNAYISVTEEDALKKAAVSDARRNKGENYKLDGIPIAVKDNFNVKGVLTTCASKMLENYTSPYTAKVVQKLLDEGAIIIGKTNLDEFAMGCGGVDSFFGPTKNVWHSAVPYILNSRKGTVSHQKSISQNDWYIPGGSSGGSAVAVATGSCFAALGSDTGGSIRHPAAHCGIVGLKPTYGLCSRYGLIPLTNSLDVPAILTRCVEDAVLILNVIAGHDEKDSTTVHSDFTPFTLPSLPNIKGLKIGIPKEYRCSGLNDEVRETWDAVTKLLQENGAIINEVSMPHTKYSIVCYSVLNSCEVASNFSRYDGIEYGHRADEDSSTENLYAKTRHEGLGKIIRGRILAGNYFLLKRNYEHYFTKALKVRQLVTEDFNKVFSSGIDLLLTPVTLTDGYKYSEWSTKDNRERVSHEDFCTQPANLSGVPALSIPCKLSSAGLPISLQIMGKHLHEQQLLTVAKWLEESLDFPCLQVIE